MLSFSMQSFIRKLKSDHCQKSMPFVTVFAEPHLSVDREEVGRDIEAGAGVSHHGVADVHLGIFQ